MTKGLLGICISTNADIKWHWHNCQATSLYIYVDIDVDGGGHFIIDSLGRSLNPKLGSLEFLPLPSLPCQFWHGYEKEKTGGPSKKLYSSWLSSTRKGSSGRRMVVELLANVSDSGRKMWVLEFEAKYTIVLVINVVVEWLFCRFASALT